MGRLDAVVAQNIEEALIVGEVVEVEVFTIGGGGAGGDELDANGSAAVFQLEIGRRIDERNLAVDNERDAVAELATAAGCAWIAFSESPWIQLTPPNVVAGSGEVHFVVAANVSSVPRAGALNIAGDAVTVTQDVATDCDYEIVPASENFYMLGGVGRINVTARNDCSWTVVSNASWISLAGPERGTGSSVVTYVVEENRTGRQRSGTITHEPQGREQHAGWLLEVGDAQHAGW
ncbi:MAG: BACON domain-containing protein [Acidobacteria bacterium]|nr:BACON domain-containing protein [Acidobacteriota bacterium]